MGVLTPSHWKHPEGLNDCADGVLHKDTCLSFSETLRCCDLIHWIHHTFTESLLCIFLILENHPTGILPLESRIWKAGSVALLQ